MMLQLVKMWVIGRKVMGDAPRISPDLGIVIKQEEAVLIGAKFL